MKAMVNYKALKKAMGECGLKQIHIAKIMGICHETEVNIFTAIKTGQAINISHALMIVWAVGVRPQQIVTKVMWPTTMVNMAETGFGPLPVHLRMLSGIREKPQPTDNALLEFLRQSPELIIKQMSRK